MDEAGAIEQHVDGAQLLRERGDLRFIGDVETADRDQRIGERGKLVLGDVGRQHARPFGGKSERRRPADPLRRPPSPARVYLRAVPPSRQTATPGLVCKLTKRFESPGWASTETSADRIRHTKVQRSRP